VCNRELWNAVARCMQIESNKSKHQSKPRPLSRNSRDYMHVLKSYGSLQETKASTKRQKCQSNGCKLYPTDSCLTQKVWGLFQQAFILIRYVMGPKDSLTHVTGQRPYSKFYRLIETLYISLMQACAFSSRRDTWHNRSTSHPTDQKFRIR
jgi:hypothetical protein